MTGDVDDYLFTAFAASEEAARAWSRPAEAVTVSGASSELSASLSASFSASLLGFVGVAAEGASVLVDGGMRSSLPNLLWVAFGAFDAGSEAGSSSAKFES